MSLLTNLNDRLKGSLPETNRDWLRFATVLGVFLLSMLIGYATRNQQKMLILVALAGVPVVLALLLWPRLGTMLVLLTGMFVDVSGPGGINTTVIMVMLLFAVWVTDMVVFKSEIRVVASAVMPPLYGMLILSVLAFAMGQYPWFRHAQSAPLDAQAGGFAIYVLSFLAFLLVANQIKRLADLKQITWIFIALSVINVIGLALPATRSTVNALAGSIGSVYWIWIVALLYGQILFNNDLKSGWRVALGVVLALALYILFVQKFVNKSGWVPVLFVLWVMTILRSWKLGGFLTLIALGWVAVMAPRIINTESYSLATRMEILPILGQIVLANPLFGLGFGNYYFYAELFTVRGWNVAINSHNNYVDIVAQTGVLGAFVFAWLILQIALLGWSLRSRVKQGFESAYVNASLGGLLGMIVVMALGDWVLPFVYNIGLTGFRSSVMGWVFLGGLVAVEQIVKRREAKEEQAEPLQEAV